MDFDITKRVITEDLKAMEFGDYSRIYDGKASLAPSRCCQPRAEIDVRCATSHIADIQAKAEDVFAWLRAGTG